MPQIVNDDAALKYDAEFPDAGKEELSKAMRRLMALFRGIHFKFRKLLKNSLNESESWEMVLGTLKQDLIDTFETIGYMAGMLKDNSINAKIANGAILTVQGTMESVNGTFEDGDDYKWFKTLQKGSGLNFKIQASYWAFMKAVEAFLEFAEKAKKICPEMKDLFKPENLLNALPDADKKFIEDSAYFEEIKASAIDAASKL